MNRIGKAKTGGLAMGIGIVAIIGLLVWGLGFGGFGIQAQATVPGGNGINIPKTCSSEVTPDVTFNAYDVENPGTALTESTNIYRKAGNKAFSTWTQGSAITNLEPGAEYEFITGISTTDFTYNAYGERFSKVIKCQESEVIDLGLYNDEIETSLTATFYNSNHDASAETFTAGQVKKVYAKFEAGNDEVFGNPFLPEKYPNVLCLALNTTYWDSPDEVTFEGVKMDRVSVPTRYSLSAGEAGYCYKAPVITDAGQELAIRLDVDDTVAPTTNVTATLYAGGWLIDSNGELGYGVETDEGGAVATDAPDTLVFDTDSI